MKVDVLLQQLAIIENGTSLSSCPGLAIVTWYPPGDVQAIAPGGRKLTLKDQQTLTVPDDYRDQFLMRAEMTGKSWVEVQVVSMHDFGLIGVLIKELTDLASKKWPLPIGGSLFDSISDSVKQGAPQVIASGRSQVFSPSDLPQKIKIDLTAPADVLGETVFIEGGSSEVDFASQRAILAAKGAANGSITLALGTN